jgi:hypothetical protein
MSSVAEPAIPPGTISESEADRLLTVDRGNVAALIAKGDRRREAGDHRAAQAFYSAGVRAFAARPDASLGTRIRDAEQALAWLGEEFKQHLLSSLEGAGYPDERLHPRFRRSLEYMLGNAQRPAEYRAYPQKPLNYYYPDTDYCMFADVAECEWVAALEGRFPAFREEAIALLADHQGFTPYMTADRSRPQADHHGLLENPNWSKLHLWSNGAPVEEHVRRCPKLFGAIIEHVPLCHLGPRAPSIMLSLLRPGARIPPHTGMLNTRLICHLPLVVPPDCGFRVGSDTIVWQEGKVIAFDDTVEHEAWNNSAFDRLVVIFDIWRPEITPAEREQIAALFAAVDAYR